MGTATASDILESRPEARSVDWSVGPGEATAPRVEASGSGRTANGASFLNQEVVERPWGTYRSLHLGERAQVKHIVVYPGGKLSLQLHHHRAEHWVIIAGTAKVTRGTEEMMLSEVQSIFIPLGTCHRLENPGKIPLHLIEVQCGSYLGEDDILRLEDVYGRATTV